LHKTVDSYEDSFLSNPLSLRLLSSFFVILPIFVQAPWVRLEPISALCFTFIILLSVFLLNQKGTNKWFIVSSLLLGISGSWLGGCLFWGWLSPFPILHIPVEAVALPLALIGLGTNWKIGSSFYISSLFGTAVTDITIFLIGIMDQWKQVITADSENAPIILQKTSESLIQIKSLSIIVFVALILWFISKEILDLEKKYNPLDFVFVESGGDNLASSFSPELVDLSIYVIDVSAGDKIPRKGGPGMTRSDLLLINKIDLADMVGADLNIMKSDTEFMRKGKPWFFTNLSSGIGVEEITKFLESHIPNNQN